MTEVKEITFSALFSRPIAEGEEIKHVDVVAACKGQDLVLLSVGVRPKPLSGFDTVAIVRDAA